MKDEIARMDRAPGHGALELGIRQETTEEDRIPSVACSSFSLGAERPNSIERSSWPRPQAQDKNYIRRDASPSQNSLD